MWCLGRISWIDGVRKEGVLHRAREEDNNPHTMKKEQNCIFHVLCRNCFLKHVTERKKERRMAVMRIRRRRRKYLQDDLKETRSYWKLKVEALDRTQWRTGTLEEAYGPVIRQSTERMNSRYFSVELNHPQCNHTNRYRSFAADYFVFSPHVQEVTYYVLPVKIP
jgi:hypothetical protein